jgi:hypothetical protein
MAIFGTDFCHQNVIFACYSRTMKGILMKQEELEVVIHGHTKEIAALSAVWQDMIVRMEKMEERIMARFDRIEIRLDRIEKRLDHMELSRYQN